jgi:hypothetical protein
MDYGFPGMLLASGAASQYSNGCLRKGANGKSRFFYKGIALSRGRTE